jgi:predicted nucleic acid-binding protein
MIVVADTTPLNYLVLIDRVRVLEPLYGSVLIPPAVHEEMLRSLAPPAVREWASHPPAWLQIRPLGSFAVPLVPRLDAGEREAIALAQICHADALLMDEMLGRRTARDLGFNVIGTLGILKEAHERGLLDLRESIQLLQQTTYQITPAILESILKTS